MTVIPQWLFAYSMTFTVSTLEPSIVWMTDWPLGIRKVLIPISFAPIIFSNIPPTGPTVPSGFIIPVIITFGSISNPLIDAIVAIVRAAPAEGPPIIGESALIV